MYQVHTGCSPSYLSNLVTATANMSSRQALRSANSQRYEVPRTKLKFGERAFSFALLGTLYPQISKNNRILITKSFKKLLKTFLFAAAYEN